MMHRPIKIAGCFVADRDPETLLSEAYCILSILSLHIMESEGRSKPADEVMATAIDGAATLVGFAYEGVIR